MPSCPALTPSCPRAETPVTLNTGALPAAPSSDVCPDSSWACLAPGPDPSPRPLWFAKHLFPHACRSGPSCRVCDVRSSAGDGGQGPAGRKGPASWLRRPAPEELRFLLGMEHAHPPLPTGTSAQSAPSSLINFCLSIISSNALILIGQTQTRNKVSGLLGAPGGEVALSGVMGRSRGAGPPGPGALEAGAEPCRPLTILASAALPLSLEGLSPGQEWGLGD